MLSIEIPFLDYVIVWIFVDEKILIIERGISENFIFYLNLTARELLDLKYRKYVSSQQKVLSFGLVTLESGSVCLLPTLKVKYVLKNYLKFIEKKLRTFLNLNIECKCTYESKYSTKL